MHLYLLTRGIKKNVDHFVNDMLAQYYPYKWDKNGVPEAYLQCAMRPIQLWECVFPKEALPEVVATMGIQPIPKHWSWGKKYLLALRKMLHARKLPKIDPNTKRRIIFNHDIQIEPIGIKDDIECKTKGHEHL